MRQRKEERGNRRGGIWRTEEVFKSTLWGLVRSPWDWEVLITLHVLTQFNRKIYSIFY